MQTTAAAAEQE